MPNYRYVRTNNVPGPSISTTWIPAESGTIVLIDLFGLVFGFDLEPTRFRLPPEAPRELFAEFWLGGAGQEPSAGPSSSG
jgi:hypothetical protein